MTSGPYRDATGNPASPVYRFKMRHTNERTLMMMVISAAMVGGFAYYMQRHDGWSIWTLCFIALAAVMVAGCFALLVPMVVTVQTVGDEVRVASNRGIRPVTVAIPLESVKATAIEELPSDLCFRIVLATQQGQLELLRGTEHACRDVGASIDNVLRAAFTALARPIPATLLAV